MSEIAVHGRSICEVSRGVYEYLKNHKGLMTEEIMPSLDDGYDIPIQDYFKKRYNNLYNIWWCLR